MEAKNAIGACLVAMLLLLPVEKNFAQGAAKQKKNSSAITTEWLRLQFLSLVNEPIALFREDTRCAVTVVTRFSESSTVSATLKSAIPLLNALDQTKAYASAITVDLLWSNVVPTTDAYSLQSIEVNTDGVNPTLFSTKALKTFRDSIQGHQKEQGITQKTQVTVHQTILAALSQLQKSFTGVQLQVYNGKKRISQEAFVPITTTPTMPSIKVKPVSNDTLSAKEVELLLSVTYQRDGKEPEDKGGGPIPNVRDDYDAYPRGSWKTIKANEEWQVDFGDHIRGGTAQLLCRHKGGTDTFRFYIRGLNPDEATVKAYMNQYSQYWFIKKMTRLESSFQQFKQGKSYSFTKLTGEANASGEPLYGKPRGFGLKQLDNWGEKGNPKYATKQHLWNWKANIDGGVEVIKEKKAAVDKFKRGYEEIIVKWNKYNSSDKVSDSLNIEAGTGAGTTVLTITEGNNTIFAVNPTTGTQKDVYEAMWIKMFNSGTSNLYYKVTGSGSIKPKRVVNRTNSNSKNYVDDVCRQAD
ncbi:MAG: hypothetical protein LBK47_01080 [Prevotellaceae bacterium]|nr:hypothetical protein [Prevotellaceae bacterium]